MLISLLALADFDRTELQGNFNATSMEPAQCTERTELARFVAPPTSRTVRTKELFKELSRERSGDWLDHQNVLFLFGDELIGEVRSYCNLLCNMHLSDAIRDILNLE